MTIRLNAALLHGAVCAIAVGTWQAARAQHVGREQQPAATTAYAAPAAAHPGAHHFWVDAAVPIGRLKDFHGVNGPSLAILPGYRDVSFEQRLLGVNMVRTHDLYGPGDIDAEYPASGSVGLQQQPGPQYEGIVHAISDPRVIFLNPNADPEDPKSYNFAASDHYIQGIIANGARIYYRLGRSLGGGANPPVMGDETYAEIVKHVAMHYNMGWDHGFHDDIKYWEVWNEPEIAGFNWDAPASEYYTLYGAIARKLKALDPSLQVGGPAGVLAIPEPPGLFRERFLTYLQKRNIPLDFYSFHNYPVGDQDPYDYYRDSLNNRIVLDKYGFTNTKIILSEWNTDPYVSVADDQRVQSMQNATFALSALIYMLDSDISEEFYYRADTAWLGMFSGEQDDWTNVARAFAAWNALYLAPNRLAVEGTDTIGFTAAAGVSDDKNVVMLVISNFQHDPNFLQEAPDGTQSELAPSGAPLTPQQIFQFFGDSDPSKLINQNVNDYPPTFSVPPGQSLKPQNFNYRNNTAFDLTVSNLPWGNAPFTLLRFELSDSSPLKLVGGSAGRGGTAKVSAQLPPPGIELIAIAADTQAGTSALSQVLGISSAVK